MKNMTTLVDNEDSSIMTIEEREKRLASSLMEALAISDNPDLQFMAPLGFRIVVQLQEEGRKKRRNATEESWDYRTGEILIFFEPVEKATKRARRLKDDTESTKVVPITGSVDRTPLVDIIDALSEAQAYREFVGLKWFRDKRLQEKGYEWVKDNLFLHDVFTKAIRDGHIVTGKVDNPHNEEYQTTSIRLGDTDTVKDILASLQQRT